MLYRRGNVWWFKFVFAGRTFRESSKSTSKVVARAAERQRRRELEEGYHGLKKRQRPVLLLVAAKTWFGLAPVPWTGTDLGLKRSAAAVSSRS